MFRQPCLYELAIIPIGGAVARACKVFMDLPIGRHQWGVDVVYARILP